MLRTNAVNSWEQAGGPLVDPQGRLVGINVPLQTESGVIEGYAVPAKVIAAHFQDVVKFKIAKPTRAVPGNGAAALPAAIMLPAAAASPQNPGYGPLEAGPTTSKSWWLMAKAQVSPSNPALMRNADINSNGLQAAPGSAGRGVDSATNMATVGRPPAGLIDTEHLGVWRIAGFTITEIIGLAVLALAAGITGGMMTMGGGILLVAGMMVFFGYGPYIIRPVSYLTNIFVYGAAALRNKRANLIMWDTVRSVAPWAVAGMAVGYFIGNTLGPGAFAYLLGGFATLITIKGLSEILTHGSDEILVGVDPNVGTDSQRADEFIDDLIEGPERRGPRALLSGFTTGDLKSSAILGIPMGMISGILGISGGVVGTPLQRVLGRVSLRNAIANNSVLVFWASLAGAVIAFVHGIGSGLIDWRVPLTLAVIMIPGSYFGGIIGAKLMSVLPNIVLKLFYTAIMAAISVKLLFLS